MEYRPVLRDSNSAWNTLYRGIENTAVLNGLFPGEDYEIKVFSLKSDSTSTLVNITQMTGRSKDAACTCADPESFVRGGSNFDNIF